MTTRKSTKTPTTQLLKRTELGHWRYPKAVDIRKFFGFVYCIRNKLTNQVYIGKKQLFVSGKKRSKDYGKEKDWRTYTGSSDTLNTDIKKYGKDNFEFDIIDFYKTKGGLYYVEAWMQMSLECLTKFSEEGQPKYYNRTIAAIRFIPKEEPTVRTRRMLNMIRGYRK